jgi:hypothetical protein
MNRLRRAIIVGVVGASVWVLAPLLFPHWALRVTHAVEGEIAVVTIAAVAWIIAGMVKSKV